MNVLLTGGAGYIGSHVAVALLGAGYEVVLFDNLSNSKEAIVDRISEIAGCPVPFIKGDIRDEEALTDLMRERQIGGVIHLAGLKSVGESVTEPQEYYKNNVVGTVTLLSAMTKVGIYKLVFSSSATVYGKPSYLPIDESHPTGATNPYGRTKLHIEEMLSDIAASSSLWRIVCLRYFNPAGAHTSGRIGELPSGIPNNLMPYIAQVAMGQRSHLNVFGSDYDTPDGTGVRDYIHVMDLAEGHLSAMKAIDSLQNWSAINLGTGNGYSVMQMISAFEAATGSAIPYEFKERRPGDVATCYADPKSAARLLGWKARRSLQDMCESAWSWQTNGFSELDCK